MLSPIVTASNSEHEENALAPIDVTVSLISAEIKEGHARKASDGISLTPEPIIKCFETLFYISVYSFEFDTVSVDVDKSNT